MFFNRKRKEKQTSDASEYKRGYNDGYYHAISKTESNISSFNNNINYIRGYEYGYRVGTQEIKMKEFQNSKMKKENNTILNSLTHQVSNQNDNQQNSFQNPNMFSNFYNKKF